MVVLDDLGFGQLGCFGSDLCTPNMDSLAYGGTRFNRFHVTALCAPTRACLLTGRNHHSVGMGFLPEVPMDLPGYTGRIPLSAATLPRLLVEGGYSSYAVGKWHMTPGSEEGQNGPFDRWPLGMGFDEFYGFLGGGTNHWAPDLVRGTDFVEPDSNPDEGYHLTEDLAAETIRMLGRHVESKNQSPFFLYLATGAVHWPHQVDTKWSLEYRGNFDAGWEEWRNNLFHRQLELGVVPDGTRLHRRPPWVSSWRDLSPGVKHVFARQMEVFGGFLTHTDQQIGKILDFLRRVDKFDNTVFLILSDNGACSGGGPLGHFNKPSWGDLSGSGRGSDFDVMSSRVDELGGIRANNHYAWGWAWAGNTPFKLWKRYAWLGGTRTPLIIHWADGIDASKSGGVRSQFCHAIDIMPTLLELARVSPPKDVDNVDQLPIEGRSFGSALNDASAPTSRDAQYFEVMGSRSIYWQGWKATTDHVDSSLAAERKLIEGSRNFSEDSWLLFNLEEDFAETFDLSAREPDLLRKMVDRWTLETQGRNVLPLMDGLDRPLSESIRACWSGHSAELLPDVLYAAPDLSLDGEFTLSVEVDCGQGEMPTGVLCAHGDWHGGWALYFRFGSLVLAVNDGRAEQLVRTEAVDLSGPHALRMEYRAHGGTAMTKLSIDGVAVAQRKVAVDPAASIAGGLGGRLLLARDFGLPVCEEYRPPFPFNGTITAARLTVGAGRLDTADIERRISGE
ncbi:arylsulfatase [Prauserella marina]|nr:arylsulfatase [Prauserella marina]